jgi:hypothetical protein
MRTSVEATAIVSGRDRGKIALVDLRTGQRMRYRGADRWRGHRGRVNMQARKAAPFRLTTTCPRHSGRSLHLSTRLDKLAFLEKCVHISH